MQPPGPPRPFRGAQYDKNMFTFLPGHSNRDVLDESPRKRKSTSSDHQNAKHRVSGFSDSKLNAGILQEKEFQSSTPASDPRVLSKDYSDQSHYWDQKDYAAKRHRNEKRFRDSGKLQSPNQKVSSPLYPQPECHTRKEDFNQHYISEPNLHVATHKGSDWLPSVTEDLSLCENQEPNASVMTHPFDWQSPIVQHSRRREIRESNAIVVARNMANLPPSTTQDFSRHVSYEPNAHLATHKAPNGPPPKTQELNRHENCESNEHMARVANAPQSQEFCGYAHQNPVEPRAMASDSYEQASKISGESQRLPQNVFTPGAANGGLHEKGLYDEVSYKVNCPDIKECGNVGGFVRFDSAETYKVGYSSNFQQRETDSFAGFDSSKASGNNVSTSVYNLQTETNNLLKVLKLLGAASGGLRNNNDGNVQGSGHDDKMTKSPLGSTIQKHASADTNLSKNHEDSLVLSKPAGNGEIGYAKPAKECKSENEASAYSEKLWDGTLQLSTSVSVSVIAFFKSGEKMHDLSWSESVEVRGKVRLEAFEKYVQDLPRSRSRGLMVMSLCCKVGSSDAGHKGMKEVARKYREGKRVGFAKLSSDVDLYICPHSDAIITILAKHGFFKGMTAIKDVSDPLIGCVVWKKSSSSAPGTKSADINASKIGQTLMEGGTSENGQTLIEGVQNSRRDKSPELLPSPQIDQAKQSMVTQKNLTPVSGASSQLSGFKTDVELYKPALPIPAVSSKQSKELPDDDELPEYDFRGAVSQASVSNTSAVAVPISAEMKLENSTVSVLVPASHFQQSLKQCPEAQKPSFSTQEQNQTRHFQGPTAQNMGQQHSHFQGLVAQDLQQYSEAHKSSFPTQEQNQTGHFQGPAPQNMGQQSEVKIPSFHIQEQKSFGKGVASSKPRNLFDDDDMPEWCPPNFSKTREEATTKTEASFSFNNSNVAGSGFANLTSGSLLPLPPPPPPPPPPPLLTQMVLESQNHPTAPHLPRPAANGFTHENPAAIPSNIQFKERDYSSAPHAPPPPPIGNSGAVPPTQVRFEEKNPAAATPSQMQFNEREYRSAPHLPPVGNPATNNLMHHNSAASSTQMRFGDNNPAAKSSQMQVNEREYHSAPHLPPPPPVRNPATNTFMHHGTGAPLNQMQCGDKNPAAISSQMQFNERDYRSAPHVPPPPPVGNPATNNVNHHNTAAPISQMQFGNKNTAAISPQMHFSERDYLNVPTPPVNNPAKNSFMYQNPAARSNQMQFGDTNYPSAPHPPPYDKPMNDGGFHQNPAFPPGFTPNLAFRPGFDHPGTKNPIHPPIRSTRP